MINTSIHNCESGGEENECFLRRKHCTFLGSRKCKNGSRNVASVKFTTRQIILVATLLIVSTVSKSYAEGTPEDDGYASIGEPRYSRSAVSHSLRGRRASSTSHFLRGRKSTANDGVRIGRLYVEPDDDDDDGYDEIMDQRGLRSSVSHFLRGRRTNSLSHFLRGRKGAPSGYNHFLRGGRAGVNHFLRGRRSTVSHFLRGRKAAVNHFLRGKKLSETIAAPQAVEEVAPVPEEKMLDPVLSTADDDMLIPVGLVNPENEYYVDEKDYSA